MSSLVGVLVRWRALYHDHDAYVYGKEAAMVAVAVGKN